MLDEFGGGWVRGQGEKICMKLGGPVALEVRDRYGEAWRVALWLEKGNGKRALLKH